MPIDNVSTRASDLLPVADAKGADAAEFGAALRSEQTTLKANGNQGGLPLPNLRLDPAGFGDTPFREEFTLRAGGTSVRVRQDDGTDQNPTAIRDVRITGGDDSAGRYLFNAEANGRITAGGSVAAPGNPNASLSGTVTLDTTPGAVNATRLQGNAVLVPEGSPVGGIVAGSTNRLDGKLGSDIAEAGLFAPNGKGGRGASLDPNGTTLGVRFATTGTNSGETSTTQVFARTVGLQVGSASVDAEVAVGPTGQSYSATVNLPIDKNNALLAELSVRNNNKGEDEYVGALIWRNRH